MVTKYAKIKRKCRLMRENIGWYTKKGETVGNIDKGKRCNVQNKVWKMSSKNKLLKIQKLNENIE